MDLRKEILTLSKTISLTDIGVLDNANAFWRGENKIRDSDNAGHKYYCIF